MGSKTLARSDWGSRSSMGEPLTLRTPFPGRTEATATEFFLRPKHWASWFLLSDIWLLLASINNDYLIYSIILAWRRKLRYSPYITKQPTQKIAMLWDLSLLARESMLRFTVQSTCGILQRSLQSR